ncbi:unnamed protein product [Arctogadus glacialis]
MAAAATRTVSVTGKNKPHNIKEHVRRTRENSRRRQAALLFLSNISLDGRPARSTAADSSDSDGNELGSPGIPGRLPRGGTVPGLAAAESLGPVHSPSTPRVGLLNHVPPLLVLPSDAGFDDSGAGGLLPLPGGLLLPGRRTASFSSPGTLLSPSPSRGSLLPSPVGPRKSSTLLSVHSCTSVSSEPRQRSYSSSSTSCRPSNNPTSTTPPSSSSSSSSSALYSSLPPNSHATYHQYCCPARLRLPRPPCALPPAKHHEQARWLALVLAYVPEYPLGIGVPLPDSILRLRPPPARPEEARGEGAPQNSPSKKNPRNLSPLLVPGGDRPASLHLPPKSLCYCRTRSRPPYCGGLPSAPPPPRRLLAPVLTRRASPTALPASLTLGREERLPPPQSAERASQFATFCPQSTASLSPLSPLSPARPAPLTSSPTS